MSSITTNMGKVVSLTTLIQLKSPEPSVLPQSKVTWGELVLRDFSVAPWFVGIVEKLWEGNDSWPAAFMTSKVLGKLLPLSLFPHIYNEFDESSSPPC